MKRTGEPKSKQTNSSVLPKQEKRIKPRNRQRQENPTNSIEKVKEELSKRINRCSVIIHGLENNEAFRMLLGDFQDMADRIDDNWHLIADGDIDKLREARITKLAAVSIISVLDNYKFDYAQAQKKLAELENPKELQSSYYDGE